MIINHALHIVFHVCLNLDLKPVYPFLDQHRCYCFTKENIRVCCATPGPLYGAPAASRLCSTREQGKARRSLTILYSVLFAEDDTASSNVTPRSRCFHLQRSLGTLTHTHIRCVFVCLNTNHIVI